MKGKGTPTTRLRFTLTTLFVGIILVCCGLVVFNRFNNRLRMSFAVEQVYVFRQLVSSSHNASQQEIKKKLRYAVEYYPSGTKQVTGSALDRLVEDARAIAVRALILELVSKTGGPFDENPENWITPQPDEL